MDNSDRAKQFLSFDALEGLKEALHEKEIEHEQRRELSQEQNERLSYIISSIDKNEIVNITYYNKERYIKIKGKVDNIDYVRKFIVINGVKISFKNIVEIEV